MDPVDLPLTIDRVLSVSKLQLDEGFWELTPRLIALLGLDYYSVCEAVQEATNLKIEVNVEIVCATALTIAFLEVYKFSNV